MSSLPGCMFGSCTLSRDHSRSQADRIAMPTSGLTATRPSTDAVERTVQDSRTAMAASREPYSGSQGSCAASLVKRTRTNYPNTHGASGSEGGIL
jgi:hypothetical protein